MPAPAAAGGDVLVPASDAELPTGCLEDIDRVMKDPTISGGYFRIRLPRGLVYRLTDTFAHYAGTLLRMRCGDHGYSAGALFSLILVGFRKCR